MGQLDQSLIPSCCQSWKNEHNLNGCWAIQRKIPKANNSVNDLIQLKPLNKYAEMSNLSTGQKQKPSVETLPIPQAYQCHNEVWLQAMWQGSGSNKCCVCYLLHNGETINRKEMARKVLLRHAGTKGGRNNCPAAYRIHSWLQHSDYRHVTSFSFFAL